MLRKITKKMLEDCIVNINHNSDNMAKVNKEILEIIHTGFVRSDIQHENILNELKRTNHNWFTLATRMLTIFVMVLIGVFALVGIKLGGLL